MGGTDLIGDYVVLYSDIQDAYHVERRDQYSERGKTNGNWLVVDQAGSYVEGLLLAGERRQAGKDKPR